MKKYFFIAAAAVVALASCSKVEADLSSVPQKRIGFEVANYMSQTKALGNGTSIWGEFPSGTTPSFYTSAYYYPTTGTPNQTYMDKVQIKPFQSDDATAATDAATTAIWRSEVEYFWPRTGYINFFSFASVRDIATSVSFADATGEAKTINIGTATSPITIAGTDNILLADACYNGQATTAGEGVDTITGTGEVTPTGVPTLFRHLLSQVQFQAQLKSTKVHANTVFEVDITAVSISGTTGTGIHSNGYLEATSTAKSGDALQIQTWGTSGNVVWSNASTPTYDAFTLATTTSALVLPVNATANTEHTSTAVHTLLAYRAFRPQNIGDDVTLNITYKVRAKHGDTVYSEETITSSANLKTFTPNNAWRCNDKINYLINIDPVTSRITFDPAVTAWADEATANIVIPQ